MSTFSQVKSHNGKFNLKLEYSGMKPSKMFIEVVAPRNESVSVYDLAHAIYHCSEGGHNSFKFNSKIENLPCEVIDGLSSQNIKISWFNSFNGCLADIASQISI